MLSETLLEQPLIQKYLANTITQERAPHAQLFLGDTGYGVLPIALAYAEKLIAATNSNTNIKIGEHPDIHFVFPVGTTNTVKKHPRSDLFLKEWRAFIQDTPYGTLSDWYDHIGVSKKEGQIGVEEAGEIAKKMHLKSYQGGAKVMLIWQAEQLNPTASNKLLKLLEEPPKNTFFILIAQDEKQLLNTIVSRFQMVRFSPLPTTSIVDKLQQSLTISEEQVALISAQSQGNYRLALEQLQENEKRQQFEQWMIQWIRIAFKARGNKAAILPLLEWSKKIADQGQVMQKDFLRYCIEFFRNALLLNYGVNDLVFFKPKSEGFKLSRFAPFIHSENIIEIQEEIEKALYHIERNANAKIVFNDTSIQLTRLLHKKG